MGTPCWWDPNATTSGSRAGTPAAPQQSLIRKLRVALCTVSEGGNKRSFGERRAAHCTASINFLMHKRGLQSFLSLQLSRSSGLLLPGCPFARTVTHRASPTGALNAQMNALRHGTIGTTSTLSTVAASNNVSSSPLLPASLPSAVHKALPWVGNGAFLALASGFVMTDIFALRVLLVGGYSGLVTFHALHPHPLRIPLIWSAVFVMINSGMVLALLADRMSTGLDESEIRLHQEHFPQLTPGQFRKLMRLGDRECLPPGTQLTTEREVSDQLYFICDGTARLYLNSAYTADISRGGFVNDVAFQAGDDSPSYGTIRAATQVDVISWSQAELRRSMQMDPALAQCLHHVLVASLVRRLLQQRDQRDSSALSGSGLQHKPTGKGNELKESIMKNLLPTHA